MSKRARYVGPFDEVNIGWPPGAVYPEKKWTVKQGHWLPEDAPAKLRDELLRSEDWSEVEQQADTSSKKKEE